MSGGGKKPNLMQQNSLLTAGKKQSDVDKFFDEVEEDVVEKVEVVEPVETQPEVEEPQQPVLLFTNKKVFVKKKYANFYLKESLLDRIDKYAGKGKGKTGFNKSELVEKLLEYALDSQNMK